MPEQPPPDFAENTAVSAAQALTSEAISAVLADFGRWLASETNAAAPQPQQANETVDLHTLLGQFTAVRHEVNLQTRAARAQQEQNAETLRQLTAALDALRQGQSRGEQARRQVVEEAIRPLLKTLIELHDALSIAGREVQRIGEALTVEETPTTAPPRSFWMNVFRPSPPPLPSSPSPPQRERQMLASLTAGYTMSLQRVERALQQHGLEAIAALGQRFDPELMEVVEAVVDSGRPAGEVIDEARRGYLWNGRVFRYAQVRVAKG